MTSNFAIVNMRDGIRRDVQSFLPENDSFPILENAYLFRGRIQKRGCFSPVGVDGRLKGTVGTTNGGGTLVLLDGTPPLVIPTGIAIFVINGSILTDPGGPSPVVLLTTGAVTGTLDRATGTLTTNAPNTAVVYIPGLPVMGLKVREQQFNTTSELINDEQLIAFDTRYTYLFDVGSNDYVLQNTFAVTSAPFVWTGSDSDFFWTTNYFKAFWATNNVPGFHASQDASPIAEGDGIRWYGTENASGNLGWSNFNPGLNGTTTPPVAATQFLTGALILLPYKNRLLALNTLEGPSLAGSRRFSQRARWSQNGTPFYGNFPAGTSAQLTAWSEVEIGRGGFIDAPTSEVIVSAEFIKDTLIVYFERSTWQLIYTYNETLPFVWQKINTELGTESTYSIVPFDRGVFGVGNYGIITTDSVNVVRIDEKIPDEVFQIQNINNGVKRVHGIRDYTAQLVYWTFPQLVDEDNDAPNYTLTFPNQLVVYNYLDGSWAEFDDCFTCFGYWQKFADQTWGSLKISWESASFAWNSGVTQGRFPDVIAGNQRGFTMVFSQLVGLNQNSPSIPIDNLTPGKPTLIFSPNHNFTNNQFVMVTGVVGTTGLNGNIYKVTVIDENNFSIDGTSAGVYLGGGLLTHFPVLRIQTKEFNPFYQNGDSVRLNYVDLYLDNTTNGQFTAQFYTSDNTTNPIETDIVLSSPEPMPTYSKPSPTANFQLQQNKIWHRVYSNAFGSFVQNIFTLSDDQMKDPNIATSDFTMHGLIYYVNAAGRVSYDI